MRHLQALLHRVAAERGDDLLARRGQRALGDVLPDQVDRRDQRLCLDRQQSRRAVEVVAVGLGVHLDFALLLEDFRIQHIRAPAEVDDVQHVDVLAQLLLAQLQPLPQLGERLRRCPARPAWIRMPASVTRRAKRSGRIAASTRRGSSRGSVWIVGRSARGAGGSSWPAPARRRGAGRASPPRHRASLERALRVASLQQLQAPGQLLGPARVGPAGGRARPAPAPTRRASAAPRRG